MEENVTTSEGLIMTNATTEAAKKSSQCQSSQGGEDWGLDWPIAFCEFYFSAHGYIALAICTYGLISNIFTVVIFSRRSMRTPINLLLTAIAVAGSLTMIPYIPYAIYFYIIVKCVNYQCKELYSQFWMTYMIVSNRVFITFHIVAIWLLVALSVIRWISVCHHTHAKTMCSMNRVKITIATVTFLGVVISTPNYLEVEATQYKPGYWLGYLLDPSVGRPLIQANFVVFGIILRLVPCVFMIILTIPIIMKVHQSNKMRVKMFENESKIRSMATMSSEEGEKEKLQQTHSVKSIGARKSTRQSTTVMLVTIVLFFVSVEMPIGLLCLASFNNNFRDNVYNYLGDLQDDLVLLNSAVNFTLYCVMSAQFRQTCRATFTEWFGKATSTFHIKRRGPQSTTNTFGEERLTKQEDL